jgi:hypothetical protein
VFSNRPDKAPHQTEPIRRRTQLAFLKSRVSTKMFRRSDFRNASSVRKEKFPRQNLIAAMNQMLMKCTRLKQSGKPKWERSPRAGAKIIRSRDHEK